MSHIPHGTNKGTCIVVADGARARLYVFGEPGENDAPVLLGDLQGDRRPSREIGSERPGRTFESANTARHAYAPRVDWHTFEKHLFARRVAELVEETDKRHGFKQLVLVAPPKALGELRAALPQSLSKRIKATVDKDLTGLAEHELTTRLKGLAAQAWKAH